jgi:hypothetical protein
MIPLKVSIERGRLIIEIGVAALAHGYEYSEHGQPYDEDKNEYAQAKVVNPGLFAKEVRDELVAEREDGATPVSLLLDSACQKAVENGSQAVLYPKLGLCRPKMGRGRGRRWNNKSKE